MSLAHNVAFSRTAWREAGHRYYGYSFSLRQRFNARIRRISIDAKFTCPNVDGTVATGGCVFCDNRSFSPSRRLGKRMVTAQLDVSIAKLRRKYPADGFLAYFQPGTNTYAPVDRLEELYAEALAHPEVVGLVIGTRPDCVPDDVLDLLERLASQHLVAVEYGVQTIHNASLDWMNRGHHYEVFPDCMRRSEGRGFEIGVHLILGLPGESWADMMASVEEMSRYPIDSIKIHNLYAVKNTPLARWVEQGEVAMLDRATYVSTLVDALERLPPTVVVERISGEAPPEFLVAPQWCLDKQAIRRAIDAELESRDVYQGQRFLSQG